MFLMESTVKVQAVSDRCFEGPRIPSRIGQLFYHYWKGSRESPGPGQAGQSLEFYTFPCKEDKLKL